MKTYEKSTSLRTRIKSLSWQKKALLTIALLILLAFYFVGICYLFAWIFKDSWVVTMGDNFVSTTLQSKFLIFLDVFAFGATIFAILFNLFDFNKKNKTAGVDNRGVSFMEKSTFGSSRWMDKTEAKEAYYVGNIANTTTTIYGQFTDKGQSVVGYLPYKKGGSGDRNTLIIGAPGTGKSYSYVRTEIIQSVLRGASICVTDPSGELYSSLAQFCEDRGYKTQVLNLAEPNYSDFWDCLAETLDPETGRLDGTRLNEFADIYMKNSSTGEKEEIYWYNQAKNILKAAIGYCAWKREITLLSGYKALFEKMCPFKNPAFEDVMESMSFGTPLIWCKNQIYALAEYTGEDKTKVDELVNDIEKSAPAFNMSAVFDAVMRFKEIEKDFAAIEDSHPAKISYNIYASTDNENVRGSARQGLQVRMQLFSDEKLKNIISHPGINLSELNREKTAYFVILSDKSTATKPIASLFFSFLIKDAEEQWDNAAHIANETGRPNPCLPVTVMLDEFFSIGVIGGNPDSFAVTMSTARKRQLHISIIIQSYPQIETLYGKSNALTIQTCCSTIVFLGSNDPATCQFISEFASGISTVLNESHSEKSSIFDETSSKNISSHAGARALLTIDEVRRWTGKVLVVRRGELPLSLEPFPYTQHPCYIRNELKPVSIYSKIVPVTTRLPLEKKFNDFELSDLLDGLTIEPEINEVYEDNTVEVEIIDPVENESLNSYFNFDKDDYGSGDDSELSKL